MKFIRWILPIALVYGAFANAQGPEMSKYTGKMVPAFSLKTYSGKTISNASLKGKPYILDFWATWCGPCKAASPLMQKLHAKYASKGLVVIGANMGESAGSAAAALKYPSEHKYTYTFTSKSDGLYTNLKMPGGIPCFIFVDKTGKIKAARMGYSGTRSEADFEAIVKTIL